LAKELLNRLDFEFYVIDLFINKFLND
jgi:hypothetical protein